MIFYVELRWQTTPYTIVKVEAVDAQEARRIAQGQGGQPDFVFRAETLRLLEPRWFELLQHVVPLVAQREGNPDEDGQDLP